MTENVSKCAPLGKLGFECLWDVCVGGGVLLADPWGEGKSQRGGQSQAGEGHSQRSVDNHREVTPGSPW